VTLSDEEARRRGTRKSVLERKAPPTFDAVVELQGYGRVRLYETVAEAVDALLRGEPIWSTRRWLEAGEVASARERVTPQAIGGLPGVRLSGPPFLRREREGEPPPREGRRLKLFAVGVNRAQLERALRHLALPAELVELEEAELVLTTRDALHKMPRPLREAEERGLPIEALPGDSGGQIRAGLLRLFDVGERAHQGF
jgi:hypothetical protein